jgi:hypothetical protein
MKSFLPIVFLLLNCSADRNKASAQAKPSGSQEALTGTQSVRALATTEAEPLGALDTVSALPLNVGESAALLAGESALQTGLVGGESAAQVVTEAAEVQGTAESAPSGDEVARNEPSWINEKVPSAMFWGIGSAKQSNDTLALTMAAARARVDIARQVDRFAQKSGYTKATQQNILSMELENSRIIRQWQAPDRTWWCLVEYSEAEAQKALGKLNLGG